MPNGIEHITNARHNRQFWNSFDLNTTSYLDWVVVGIFYEGVHWIEAFLSSKAEHSSDHKYRLSAMKRHIHEMGPIIKEYEKLKIDSMNARYDCYKYTQIDISGDLIPLIDKIKKHVENLLSLSSSTSPWNESSRDC